MQGTKEEVVNSTRGRGMLHGERHLNPEGRMGADPVRKQKRTSQIGVVAWNIMVNWWWFTLFAPQQ